MIMRALERSASEQRIARALNVDVPQIRQKRRLLNGICSEVVVLLKDKHLAGGAIAQLKKMRPSRQIEAAELMLAANNFSEAYARALLAATPQDQLVSAQAKRISGVSFEQMARMEREMANVQRDLKLVETPTAMTSSTWLSPAATSPSCSRHPTWPVTSSAIRPTSPASSKT